MVTLDMYKINFAVVILFDGIRKAISLYVNPNWFLKKAKYKPTTFIEADKQYYEFQ